jgi:hypothetical protein
MRVAFVFGPNLMLTPSIDSMPFAANTLTCLAEDGHQIDLFVTAADMTETAAKAHPLIHIQSFAQALSCSGRVYDLVIGVGQVGICVAACLAERSECLLVYYNDELPSGVWPPTPWQELEQRAASLAGCIIVPDKCREEPLRFELRTRDEVPFFTLPNVPLLGSWPEINWAERLRMPKNSAYFLTAGTVADWAQVPELLATVPFWPADTVLVVHSRLSMSDETLRQYSHLNFVDRVFWSRNPLDDGELNSLVAGARGSFSLYRNVNSNIEQIGLSSGKLARSIFCSTPVIASDLESLRFVEREGLGIIVSHPCQIPRAIQKVNCSHAQFAQRCRDFTIENLNYRRSWSQLAKHLSNFNVASASLTDGDWIADFEARVAMLVGQDRYMFNMEQPQDYWLEQIVEKMNSSADRKWAERTEEFLGNERKLAAEYRLWAERTEGFLKQERQTNAELRRWAERTEEFLKQEQQTNAKLRLWAERTEEFLKQERQTNAELRKTNAELREGNAELRHLLEGAHGRVSETRAANKR